MAFVQGFGSGSCDSQVAKVRIRVTNEFNNNNVDYPSHTVSSTSPPPASLAHSLISARDMHLATRMFCCLCHFALRCEPSWAPMACARLQHNGESCLLLDSSRPSFCLSVSCPSRYKRPCTSHTRGLSHSLSDTLSDSPFTHLFSTLLFNSSVTSKLHTCLFWSTTKASAFGRGRTCRLWLPSSHFNSSHRSPDRCSNCNPLRNTAHSLSNTQLRHRGTPFNSWSLVSHRQVVRSCNPFLFLSQSIVSKFFSF